MAGIFSSGVAAYLLYTKESVQQIVENGSSGFDSFYLWFGGITP